ncbi:hypothetical protein TeGR_g15216 [Tetraparma gracilis]|uniref:Uncharacterized protein n=1 Tax=Tetraparma gracilis TaxID=2962635 RepID=A0ABQ6N9W6_9STRA|nr:hypothetical protein TeGR_g15216 [Tetraparma gracilis]
MIAAKETEEARMRNAEKEMDAADNASDGEGSPRAPRRGGVAMKAGDKGRSLRTTMGEAQREAQKLQESRRSSNRKDKWSKIEAETGAFVAGGGGRANSNGTTPDTSPRGREKRTLAAKGADGEAMAESARAARRTATMNVKRSPRSSK